MNRAARVTVLFTFVVFSACDDAASSTTTTEVPATSSSTTTTTALAETEIDLGTAGLQKWAPGTAYTENRFWEPVAFTVEEEGWWARGASDIAVHLEYHADGESLWDLDVSVIAPNPTALPESVVSSIARSEKVEVVAEPMASTVAGHDAIVLDVVALEPTDGPTSGIAPCDRGGRGHSRFYPIDPGFALMIEEDPLGGNFTFGVRSCRAARIWVVDVDGSTIVIIAATYDEELFDGLIPHAENLLTGIRFGD